MQSHPGVTRLIGQPGRLVQSANRLRGSTVPPVENAMFTVTEAARKHLSQTLTDTDAAPETSIRILRRTHGWALRTDQGKADDKKFDLDGRTVLLLDPVSSETLTDKTLDVNEEGSRLSLH
jgi:hypothetical protein